MFSLRKITVLILIILIIPFIALAEEGDDLGTITINTVAQDNNAISGKWYLHRGGANGTVVRNGLSGETFNVEVGTYYLEARRTSGGDVYKAYQITTENPQSVAAGESATFNVRYYRTQEDLDAALLAQEIRENDQEDEQVEEVVEELTEETIAEEVVEEEVLDEPTEEEEVTQEDSVIGSIIDYVVETTEEVDVYVPTFETAPEPVLEVGGVNGEILEEVTELAVTGPGVLALLIPSALGSLFFVSRKRK